MKPRIRNRKENREVFFIEPIRPEWWEVSEVVFDNFFSLVFPVIAVL